MSMGRIDPKDASGTREADPLLRDGPGFSVVTLGPIVVACLRHRFAPAVRVVLEWVRSFRE